PLVSRCSVSNRPTTGLFFQSDLSDLVGKPYLHGTPAAVSPGIIGARHDGSGLKLYACSLLISAYFHQVQLEGLYRFVLYAVRDIHGLNLFRYKQIPYVSLIIHPFHTIDDRPPLEGHPILVGLYFRSGSERPDVHGKFQFYGVSLFPGAVDHRIAPVAIDFYGF